MSRRLHPAGEASPVPWPPFDDAAPSDDRASPRYVTDLPARLAEWFGSLGEHVAVNQ